MKAIFLALLMLIAFTGSSSADEIYMNDLRVIKGKIIQVTDKNVEFSQEGKPLLIVPRDQVFKIKYDDGQEVQIADLKGQDKIYLKDGSIVKGTIVKVTPDVIIYSATDKQEAAVRDNVVKIEYADGKVIQMSEGQIVTQPVQTAEQDVQQEEEIEPVIRSGGFIDSNIWFNTFFGISNVFGNIHDKENGILEEEKDELTILGHDASNDYSLDTTGYHFGFELNLMLPSIKYKQSRGFDLTGIKFGLKTTYVFSEVYQDLIKEEVDDDTHVISDGRLLKYRSVNAGPEVNFIFSPRSDLFNMIVQLYGLGGYIHNGKLTAAPALRDEGVPITDPYEAEFTGYSITAGIGHYIVFNKMVPITLGNCFYYSYSKIEFDRNVAIYNGANETSFKEFGFILSAGVHF